MDQYPQRFRDKVDFSGDCWLWKATKNDKGYGQYYHQKKLVYAHRFSYELFNGEIPAGMNILHSCDVPLCVNPAHLSFGTQKDNVADMMRKGRGVFLTGEDIPNSKLTKAHVEEIRKLYTPGRPGLRTKYSQRNLAKMFGVANTTIQAVLSNRTWI